MITDDLFDGSILCECWMLAFVEGCCDGSICCKCCNCKSFVFVMFGIGTFAFTHTIGNVDAVSATNPEARSRHGVSRKYNEQKCSRNAIARNTHALKSRNGLTRVNAPEPAKRTSKSALKLKRPIQQLEDLQPTRSGGTPRTRERERERETVLAHTTARRVARRSMSVKTVHTHVA